MDYLSKEEVGAFLQKASEHGARTELLARILTYTGARIGEILPLTPGDLDPAKGQITLSKDVVAVANLGTKSGHGRLNYRVKRPLVFLEEGSEGFTGEKKELSVKEAAAFFKGCGEAVKSGLKAAHPIRTIPITDRPTLAMLSEWIRGRPRSSYLFVSQKGHITPAWGSGKKGSGKPGISKRLGYTAAFREIQETMIEAGIPKAKAHPHNLRHSFAVNALKKGVPINVVQRILGHSNIATTTIYLRLVVDDLRDALGKAGLYE